MAAKHDPRWAQTKNQGANLNFFASDPNYLFKKSLLPLDKNKGRIQNHALKRSQPFGRQFREEISSIIRFVINNNFTSIPCSVNWWCSNKESYYYGSEARWGIASASYGSKP